VEEASDCRRVEWTRELQQEIELDPNYAVQTRTSQIFSDAPALRCKTHGRQPLGAQCVEGRTSSADSDV